MVKINTIYEQDIKTITNLKCDVQKLKNKTLLITGGTGLIGTYLVDMLLYLNKEFSLNMKLILITRNPNLPQKENVTYLVQDILEPINISEKVDYVIHGASNTHPVLYSTKPIETITTNVIGIQNLLEIVKNNTQCKFLFLSSVEIYGEDISNNEKGFSEKDFGYLDCNTLRAGYCESKRLGETLCHAYATQHNIEFTIARLCRCYGPTLKSDDSKALSQFLKNAVNSENIVLKSDGNQFYSYLYASDAATALIFLLLQGKNKEAYNVASEKSNITLKDLSLLIAKISDVQVVFEKPNEIEKKGYSKATRAILNPEKIFDLGWSPTYDIKTGIGRTLNQMRRNHV